MAANVYIFRIHNPRAFLWSGTCIIAQPFQINGL
jgi:hypothetical protein